MSDSRHRNAQAAAQEAANKANEQLAAAASRDHIGPGNLYALSLELPEALEWLVVRAHKDQAKLWYVVAADTHPLVGSSDVEVPCTALCGPLSLRCGQGLWIHEDDFYHATCVGSVSEDYVSYARDRLATIVKDTTVVSAAAASTDADSEYRDWMDRVSQSVNEVEDLLHREPQVVSLASFVTCEAPPAQLSLAAASVERLEENAESAKEAVLERDLPGKLLAFLYVDHVVLVYEPSSDGEVPKRITYASAVDVSQGEWDQDVNGSYVWTQKLPLADGELTLRGFGLTLKIE